MRYRIFPLSEAAATVEFGNAISAPLNDLAIGLSRRVGEAGFPGFVETFPAFSSVTVFYDLPQVRRAFPAAPTAFDAVRSLIEGFLGEAKALPADARRVIEVPVMLGGEEGPDLETIAAERDLGTDEFIEIFLSRTYRVFMLGFLPGFAYMGEVDQRIASPRRATPRRLVRRGSVGIAGTQTGIYSLESPGGWQIIGRTDLELFNPLSDEPTLFRAGDEVRFVASGD